MPVRQPLDCALLSLGSNFPFHDLLLITPGLRIATLEPAALGLHEAPNPYGLPLTDRASVALVDTRWYKWLRDQGSDLLERTFAQLERVADRIVGIEGYDTIRLGAPPDALDRYEMLLKSQGVYRDRELYNFKVGPYFPGGRWTEKAEPEARRFSDGQLEKIRLSLPCFVGVDERVRVRVRRARAEVGLAGRWLRAGAGLAQQRAIALAPRRPGPLACFVGAMSHLQRLDLVRSLDDAGVSGTYGITGIPEYVFGWESPTELVPEHMHTELDEELRRRGRLAPRVSRYRLQRMLQRHHVALAPTGYGELTHRHAEAWIAGSAVLCQSLEHVETMFPFRDGENVIYCRPGLEDVIPKLEEAERDPAGTRRIADNGRRTWANWIAPLDDVLRRGVTDHLHAS